MLSIFFSILKFWDKVYLTTTHCYSFPVFSHACFCSYLYCCVIIVRSFSGEGGGGRPLKPTQDTTSSCSFLAVVEVRGADLAADLQFTAAEHVWMRRWPCRKTNHHFGTLVARLVARLSPPWDANAPVWQWSQSWAKGLHTCSCIFSLFFFSSCSLCTKVKWEVKGGDERNE